VNWSNYPNFTKTEFDCSYTGKNEMQPSFMEALQKLRTEYGKPMVVTSGYRDPTHPQEAKKPAPGQHSKGLAVDIACDATEAHKIIKLAMAHGFKGVGVSQRAGTARFVHLDMREGPAVVYGY